MFNESDDNIGEGKYEVRYHHHGSWKTERTDSWVRFIKLRLTENIVFYKVYNK